MPGSDTTGSRWMFVASSRNMAEVEFPHDALAAAPPEVAAGGLILPRDRVEDRCRLCGTVAELTREHVPPRSAGNTATSVAISIEDWLRRETLDDVPGGTTVQGGTWGRTLCASCNRRTGQLYAREYARWARRAARLMIDELPPCAELDDADILKALVVSFEDVRPGAFTRQVLSLMATLSGPWDIAGRHPEIRAMVLDGATGELPEGMALGMTFYCGPNELVAGPFLVVDRTSGAWRWSLVLAFPPLAFEMVLASEGEYLDPMCGIADFLGVGNDVRANAELEVFVAFGHTALPTDWRSRAQIEKGLTIYGAPDVPE